MMRSPKDRARYSPGIFAGLVVATGFFTRLPIDPHPRAVWRLADSAWAFPLVGAGIGAVAAFAFLLPQLVGLGVWPAAVIAVIAGLALTGALHEDGLADTADGFFGGRDREEKLAIMRDSRAGVFAVLAVVISVLLRCAALATIGDPIHAALALIAAHAASRAALPAVMAALQPARADGLGATAGIPGNLGVVAAALIGILIALAMLGPMRGTIALGLTSAMIAAAAGLAHRHIGGYTGDVLGACQQIGEIVMLLAASAR